MNKYNIELNSEVITQLGIKSLIDFYDTIAMQKANFSGFKVFLTGIESPFLNVIIDTQTNQHRLPTPEIKEFFEENHVPWAWFLTPLVKSYELNEQEFSFSEETPSMYFDLQAELPEQHNKDIKIIELHPNDSLKTWIQPIAEAFKSSDNGEGYRQLNERLIINTDKLKHFIATYNNKIASAGTLFLSSHGVMLHNLATKSSFQNLGIGTALTLRLMKKAKKLGHQHCFLDSSSEGFNLYKKLGFKTYGIILTYCKL